jgi:hypothetical protein
MSGILGTPMTDEEDLGDKAGGQRRHYRSVLRGTQHQVSVRMPKTVEEPTCHHPDLGVRILVESSVYWSPKTGAHVVQGEIRDHWLNMGGHESELGYPISDEMNTADGHGRRSLFEFGEISWYPDSGVTVKKRDA